MMALLIMVMVMEWSVGTLDIGLELRGRPEGGSFVQLGQRRVDYLWSRWTVVAHHPFSILVRIVCVSRSSDQCRDVSVYDIGVGIVIVGVLLEFTHPRKMEESRLEPCTG
jgi:hypothetical protein